ncbi:hypothetical protein LCGC14_2120530 [marine sediment metagenome]|uniref:Uncharacterized protein n=1 Tax=marine sediment metagenome TaxID=412755 RepID=A0A0F9E4F2_9ZZZZ
MVEVNFKGIAIASLLVGIFVFALLSFGNQIAIDNNVPNILLEEEQFNRTFRNLDSNLSEAIKDINASRGEFFKDIPIIGEITIILSSIVAVGRVFTVVVRNLYSLTLGLIAETLGISPIVMGILSSIILVSIILLIWRVYRSGG